MNYKKSQNTFTDNTLLFQIIFAAVIIGGVILWDNFLSTRPFLTNNKRGEKATLLIEFGNMTRRFEGEALDGMTILDALNASVAAGEIKFHYVIDLENNTTVREINDHTAMRGEDFSFYINGGAISTQDLNKTTIRPKDEIVIKLE